VRRSAYRLVLVGWLCAAGAAFYAMFDHGTTDDYSGWIPAVVVLQVPGFVALRPWATETEEGRVPMPGGRRWALMLTAALAAAVGVFWIAGCVGSAIWEPKFLELRPLLLAGCAGLAGVFAAAIGFARILRHAPHPRGARRVLLVVTGLGVAGVGAMAMPFLGRMRINDVGELLLVGLPLVWACPMWLLLALEPPPEPPIPRASVR